MVVGANSVVAADPDAPKVHLVLEVNDGIFPFIGNATQSSCSCLGKCVVAAEPAIQHANTPNDHLELEIIDSVFSSQRPDTVPNRIVSTIRS